MRRRAIFGRCGLQRYVPGKPHAARGSEKSQGENQRAPGHRAAPEKQARRPSTRKPRVHRRRRQTTATGKTFGLNSSSYFFIFLTIFLRYVGLTQKLVYPNPFCIS